MAWTKWRASNSFAARQTLATASLTESGRAKVISDIRSLLVLTPLVASHPCWMELVAGRSSRQPVATFENPPLRARVPGLEFAGNVDDLAALVAPRSLTLLNVNPVTSLKLAANAYRLSRAAAEFRCQSASVSFSLSYGPTTGGQVVEESGVKALKVPGSQPYVALSLPMTGPLRPACLYRFSLTLRSRGTIHFWLPKTAAPHRKNH